MKKLGVFTLNTDIKVLSASLIMILSACSNPVAVNLPKDDKAVTHEKVATPTETLKQIDNSLANVGKITKASEVTLDVVPFAYKLPKAVKDVCNDESNYNELPCPQISVSFTKTNPVWIGERINREVSQDDNHGAYLKFTNHLDKFALSQVSDKSEIGYEWTVVPKRLDNHNNVVQVAIHENTYTGGAHGVETMQVMLFDMDLQSQIDYTDIIDLDNGDFYHLLEQAYDAFIADLGETDIKAYKETHPFEVSQVMYFDKKGIVFVYQPYQIASYAAGIPTLTLSYDKINHLLKPQYQFKASLKIL